MKIILIVVGILIINWNCLAGIPVVNENKSRVIAWLNSTEVSDSNPGFNNFGSQHIVPIIAEILDGFPTTVTQSDVEPFFRVFRMIAFMAHALKDPTIDAETKIIGIKSLVRWARAVDPELVGKALQNLVNVGNKDLIPLALEKAEDSDIGIRDSSADLIRKFGGLDAASKLEKIINRRKQHLSKEEQQKDPSISRGQSAIAEIRSRFSSPSETPAVLNP